MQLEVRGQDSQEGSPIRLGERRLDVVRGKERRSYALWGAGREPDIFSEEFAEHPGDALEENDFQVGNQVAIDFQVCRGSAAMLLAPRPPQPSLALGSMQQYSRKILAGSGP